MASTSLLPEYIPTNVAGIVIACIGSSTSWVGGMEPTIFSISGTNAPTITSQTYVSATKFTLVLSGTLYPGTYTIHNTTDLSTATLTVIAWQLATDNDYWTLTGPTWSGPLRNGVGAGTTYFTPGTDGAWIDLLGAGSSKITVSGRGRNILVGKPHRDLQL